MYANRSPNNTDIHLLNLFRDPLVRRFISAAFFAAAFVWVAIVFFDVETEVVRVLFIYSVGLVLLMVLAALVLFPLVGLFRKKRSRLLETVDNTEGERGEEKQPARAEDE